MKQTQLPSKRIVSKREYFTALIKKGTFETMGLFWIILSLLLVVLGACIIDLRVLFDGEGAILTGTFFACACLSGFIGIRMCNRSDRVHPGVPLTRANTADLPVPESLVRASQESVHAHEAVLLRAATQDTEIPPEQLLRAVDE